MKIDDFYMDKHEVTIGEFQEFVKATNYITARFKNEDSIIFVSRRQDSTLNGFVQLYPSYCSVSTIPILILYDLFVDESERAKGKGRLLMNAARDYAKENGYKRLELSTAKDNYIGQSLYESLGYALDKEFLQYSLEID